MKRDLQLTTVASAVVLLCLMILSAAPPGTTASPGQDKRAQGTPSAATLYAKTCATCHGKDGQARTFKAKFNHARNLSDAVWQQSVSDEHLFNSISNGKGKMPSFGKKFSESEINALVAYVRQLKK